MIPGAAWISVLAARVMPCPAKAKAIADIIGGRPALVAAGIYNAPSSGAAGVGQKNSEMITVAIIRMI